MAAFQARGFTAEDLGALIGAHTTARQFNTDPSKAGAPQDSTPGVWDLLYYAQTLMGVAPFSFQSDINLTKQPQVGPFMMRFAVDKLGWDSSFTRAMAKLEVLGIADKSVLIDCTSALPHSSLASGPQGCSRQCPFCPTPEPAAWRARDKGSVFALLTIHNRLGVRAFMQNLSYLQLATTPGNGHFPFHIVKSEIQLHGQVLRSFLGVFSAFIVCDRWSWKNCF